MLFGKSPEIQADDMLVYNGEFDSFDMTISKTVKAKIMTTDATVGCPVRLWINEVGEVCCFEQTASANTVDALRGGNMWGIVQEGGSQNDIATIVVKGKATCVSGGTLGEFVTEISSAGAVTAVSGAGYPDGALGVQLANNDIYIY